jgi:exosome complex RNA-binding protein Csl4
MRRVIGWMVFSAVLSVGMGTLAFGAAAVPGPQTVNGDLLKIDGEFYVLHDITGKEIRLHVDQDTKTDGGFKTGDKVEAQVTDKGHAFSMKHVNVASGAIAAVDPRTVNGDMLKIDGEFYVVHDMTGKEIRLHVDKDTKLDGDFKTGDKIEAQVTAKGHAVSMKHGNPAK